MDYLLSDIAEMVKSTSQNEIGNRLRGFELMMGHSIISEADWLNPLDWTRRTIVSQDRHRIRLVAMEARQPGTGAFTRLIDAIERAGLIPVLVEPNEQIVAWCKRHWYRKRRIRGACPHDVWYPKRCAY